MSIEQTMEPLPYWRILTPMIVVSVAGVLCLLRPMPFLRIVMLSIGVAVSYGMLQDQLTVRLCPEYFTLAHPPIQGLTNRTMLGITWGFLGSWWVGLAGGIALAFAATVGQKPRLKAGELFKPALALVAVVAILALMCGTAGYQFADRLRLATDERLFLLIPQERHAAFIAVACAHFAAYLSAPAGGLYLCHRTIRQRQTRERNK